MSQSLFLLFFLAMISRLSFLEPGQKPSGGEELACIYSVYISCLSEYALTLIVLFMNLREFVRLYLATQRVKKYIRRTDFLLNFLKMRQKTLNSPEDSASGTKSEFKRFFRKRKFGTPTGSKTPNPNLQANGKPSNMNTLFAPTISSNIEKSRSSKAAKRLGQEATPAYPTRGSPTSNDDSIGFPINDHRSSSRVPSKYEELHQKKPKLILKNRGTTGNNKPILSSSKVHKLEGPRIKNPKKKYL